AVACGGHVDPRHGGEEVAIVGQADGERQLGRLRAGGEEDQEQEQERARAHFRPGLPETVPDDDDVPKTTPMVTATTTTAAAAPPTAHGHQRRAGFSGALVVSAARALVDGGPAAAVRVTSAA